MNTSDTRVSRYLSLILRHDPARAGLSLDAHGWTPVGFLLAALTRNSMRVTRADLQRIVDQDDKGRYTIAQEKIRANQGHSVPVDLALESTTPPPALFHGTPNRNVTHILTEGLAKRQRNHVHLSPDIQTAQIVGARRGSFAVLRVDTARMDADGYLLYRSTNGVWLADSVPARYITIQAWSPA